MSLVRQKPAVALAAFLVAVGLCACGGGGKAANSGFTGLTKIPTAPTDLHPFYPSAQMADEAEQLVEDRGVRTDFDSADCAPAKSLEGVGEYNFDCTAFDSSKGRRYKIGVVVYGSNTGEEPHLGISESECDPVEAAGVDLPPTC